MFVVGFQVVEQEQQGGGKAEYGVQLLEHLSEDLQEKLGSGLSVTNLRNMRRFYLSNRIQQPAAELNWSQHVELLPVTRSTPQRFRGTLWDGTIVAGGRKCEGVRWDAALRCEV